MALPLLVFFLIFQFVNCQVCNETRSIYREVPETFRFSYIETYEEPCIIFCSVKTRTSVNVTTRIVQRYENVTVNVCCEGYIQDESHEGNGLYCEPICNPPCQNGYCRRPNECACEVGYALDPLNPNICKPLCLQDCDIPDCLITKTPQCFSNNTDLSDPESTEPCDCSTSIAPDASQCLPGYYNSSANICEPRCSSCDHGSCIAPETCSCDVGWEWQCGSCQPVCFDCDYGTCVSPGECKCNNGYVKSDKGKCEPHCSMGCTNGKCVGPDTCRCNPGWYMIGEGGECIAHCDMHCENGDCVAPNICVCRSDFQLFVSDDKPRCVPSSKACEDDSDLESCRCEHPYEVSYSNDHGGQCDCFGICSDSIHKCTKSTCVFKKEKFGSHPLQNEGKSIRIPDVKATPLPKDDSSTIPTKNQSYKDETVSHSRHASKHSENLGLSSYWTYIIAGILFCIVILILGFIAKRKCCKNQKFHSPDKNNDVIDLHNIRAASLFK